MLPPISPGIQHATKRKTKTNKKYRQISWLDNDKLELSLYVLYYLYKRNIQPKRIFRQNLMCAMLILLYVYHEGKGRKGKENKN